MATSIHNSLSRRLWALADKQYGVVSHRQLLELGYGYAAIRHRVAKGRLHRLWPGVYAVGRRQVSAHGRWMAAVLTCGEGAVLSHLDAAAVLELRRKRSGQIEVSVPASWGIGSRKGIRIHRRKGLTAADITRCHGIPVTSVICTIIDIAPGLERGELEAAINAADKRKLTNPEQLRAALDDMPPRPGVRFVRNTLDRRTFALTRSELERRFLPSRDGPALPSPLPNIN